MKPEENRLRDAERVVRAVGSITEEGECDDKIHHIGIYIPISVETI